MTKGLRGAYWEPDATSHPKKPIRPFEMINNTSKYVRTASCQPF